MKIVNYSGSAFILILTLSLFTMGCKKFTGIDGNGHIVTEGRNTVSFNKIANEANFDVYYIKAPDFRVDVVAESNLIPHIRTIVNGNTLEVDSRKNLRNNYPIKIYVYSPVLRAVYLSGSGTIATGMIDEAEFEAVLSGSGSIFGDVYCNYFNSHLSGSGEIDFVVNAEQIAASISGSGRIKLIGEAISGDYRISGSGSIMAFSMHLAECFARISGSGSIYTRVYDYLEAIISGSGNIHYAGSPVVDANVTGSGKILPE